MQEEVRKILEQLGDGEITAEEAEQKVNELRREGDAPKHSFLGGICSCLSNLSFATCLPRHVLEEVHIGTVESPLNLDLASLNGSIKVETWEKDEYRLEIKKHVLAPDKEKAEELASPFKFAAISPSAIRAGDQECRSEAKNRISVSLQLWLPSSVTCHGQLKTVNGSIRLRGIEASELTLSSTNGSIKAKDFSGSQLRAKTVNGSLRFDGRAEKLSCTTTNGSIVANNKALTGENCCKTVNGSVKVAVPGAEATGIRVEASTVSGRFQSDHPILDSIEGGKMRSVSLRSSNWEAAKNKIRLELQSVNGSVRLLENSALDSGED